MMLFTPRNGSFSGLRKTQNLPNAEHSMTLHDLPAVSLWAVCKHCRLYLSYQILRPLLDCIYNSPHTHTHTQLRVRIRTQNI